MKQIQRKDLQPGAVIEATANPRKGVRYAITEAQPKSWNSSSVYYFAEATEDQPNATPSDYDGPIFKHKGHLTLNHIRTYYKLVSLAPFSKESIAEAFSRSKYHGRRKLKAADISEVTRVNGGVTEGGVDFHVYGGCSGTWYSLKLGSDGQPDPDSIEELPF